MNDRDRILMEFDEGILKLKKKAYDAFSAAGVTVADATPRMVGVHITHALSSHLAILSQGSAPHDPTVLQRFDMVDFIKIVVFVVSESLKMIKTQLEEMQKPKN